MLYELFRNNPTVTTDSRDCPAGSIFIALKGENFNGNRFAQQALEKGCAYAVVDEAEYKTDDERIILVDDCLEALRQLALAHRRALGTPIVGITGTNGKTTTKELTAAVLAKKYNVLFTEGNFNNDIGVPKTLLRLRPEHDIAVVEMGASHPGDIKRLVEITEPDCGLITNCGRAHLQGFGSFEGVVKTKGELFDFLRKKDGATVFVNADDPVLMNAAEELKKECYSTNNCALCIVHCALTACDPCLRFRMKIGGGEWQQIDSHLVGAYNIYNMMAAATVGHHFGVSDEDIADALRSYVPTNNRSQLTVTTSNRLVVDAYNANPSSMEAAISNFALMQADRKMLILGQMNELGADSLAAHKEVVRRLKEEGFTEVCLVGEEFQRAMPQAEAGFKTYPSVEELRKELIDNKPQGYTILIKGSNSVGLYKLPELL